MDIRVRSRKEASLRNPDCKRQVSPASTRLIVTTFNFCYIEPRVDNTDVGISTYVMLLPVVHAVAVNCKEA